jgi:hypothetical protein
MQKLEFDTSKVKLVNIDSVTPNKWNPKDKDTLEFEKVKKSVEINGLRIPIIVREVEQGFEIIDGEQRFTACKQLGYEQVIIYNEGIIEDKKAKELTIWYQQQVPFNQIELASLIKDLYIEFGEMIEIPFSLDEIKEFTSLNDFDVDSFDNSLIPVISEEGTEEKQKEIEEENGFFIKVQKKEIDRLKEKFGNNVTLKKFLEHYERT